MTKTVQKSKARDMTQGSIWKQLLLFSLPLMAGNLFQQLYNTVDSIVVGNFVGKEALAAVGSVGPIINSLIGFFMGLSTGAGVIISQYYGAKADEKVSRTVSTTLVMTFILSIVFTILGILITPYMLRMMSTPDDVIRESATYLKIYFGGVAGLMFYNMGSGVLRAVGDSRHPLYFLIFSAVVNTVLDLLFVVSFGMKGAAYEPKELRMAYETKIKEQEAALKMECRGSHVPEIDIADVFRQLFEDQAVSVTEKEIADLAKMFRAISIEELKLFPGVPEMLQRLKDAGKKVFLLSNAQALFTAPEISLLGLTRYFDGILLSSDAGVKKPDPAFYEMLLKQYHLDPAECLMTGNDDIADCHGAASAGIASRYVATRQSPKINGPLPENCEKIAAIAELF